MTNSNVNEIDAKRKGYSDVFYESWPKLYYQEYRICIEVDRSKLIIHDSTFSFVTRIYMRSLVQGHRNIFTKQKKSVRGATRVCQQAWNRISILIGRFRREISYWKRPSIAKNGRCYLGTLLWGWPLPIMKRWFRRLWIINYVESPKWPNLSPLPQTCQHRCSL